MPAERSRQIAWTPLHEPQLVRLLAIRCPPSQKLTDGLYLSYLGDRIQAMVDDLPEDLREDAVRQFQEAMYCESLLGEILHCPPDEVGVNLVISNPQVWEGLSNLGIEQRLIDVKHPLIENLMAHEALMSDRENPIDNL